MNKQELIKKLKELLMTPSELEGYDFDDGYDFGIESAITLAKDLDDPVRPPEPKPLEIEKPVVPQCVADWYEEHKGNFEIYLSELCRNFTCHRERLNDKLANWYEQLENKPIQTLVNMHQFGYEIEKEKVYTVEIPTHGNPNHFVLRKHLDGRVCLDCYISDNWRDYEFSQLTEAEIKREHDWAWKYAEEVNNNE